MTGQFKIVWKGGKEDETVDADRFQDEGDWITFTQAPKSLGASREQVLRVRGDDVDRIERVKQLSHIDVLSLVLSFIAIGFGVIEFFRQDKTRRQLAAIEEARRTEEVTARLEAQVTAQVETEPATNQGGRKSFIVLINKGHAVAHEVDFETPSPIMGKALT